MFKILFKILLGKLVALFGGFSKPELCAVYVAVYSNPVGVPYAQIKLRARNTLFCGFRIPVNCLFTGFIVAVAGEIMLMPGLSKTPSAEHIDIDENGNVTGLQAPCRLRRRAETRR